MVRRGFSKRFATSFKEGIRTRIYRMTEVVTWEWTRGVHWRDKCRRRPLTALALPHNQWESPTATLGHLSGSPRGSTPGLLHLMPPRFPHSPPTTAHDKLILSVFLPSNYRRYRITLSTPRREWSIWDVRTDPLVELPGEWEMAT